MSVDWITVAAQAVNFLVLVWLLRRFLYRPVTDAMAAREAGITERLAQAAAREAAAEDRDQALFASRARFDETREARMAEVERDADVLAQRLLDEAREAAGRARLRWRADIERDQQELLEGMRTDLAEAIAGAAGRCVAALADADLDERAFDRFMQALRDADETTRSVIAGAGEIVVVTATDISSDPLRETRLREAIGTLLGSGAQIHFDQDADLLLGAELRLPGARIGWTAASMLTEVRDAIPKRLSGIGLPPRPASE